MSRENKLNHDQMTSIYQMKGKKTASEIAKEYNVSRATITRIWKVVSESGPSDLSHLSLGSNEAQMEAQMGKGSNRKCGKIKTYGWGKNPFRKMRGNRYVNILLHPELRSARSRYDYVEKEKEKAGVTPAT